MNKIITILHLSLIILISLLFISCINSNIDQTNQAMNNNYSTSDTILSNSTVPSIKISEDQVIEKALLNNPDYKAAKFKSEAANAKYNEELSKISPTIAINSSEKSLINNNLNPVSAPANIMQAKEMADNAKMNVDNNKRRLIEKASLELNEQNKVMSMYEIAKANEAFQKKMAEKEMAKIKISKNKKLAESDYLNFKIKALMAKANAIKAECDYDITTYNIAATMGNHDAMLPNHTKITENIDQQEIISKIPSLNRYLDLAIENRPDLKAYKYELQASKYNLYSKAGALSPTISSSDKSSASVNTNLFNGGSNIAHIGKQEAKYDSLNEELNKKWIAIVKEVRSAYISLKANLLIREKYSIALKEAQERRNLIEKQFRTAKVSIASLNQAQNNLISIRKAFIHSEKNVADSRAELLASCGIENYRVDNSDIAVNKQAQQTYTNIDKSLLETEIEISNAQAGLKAAAGIQ